MRFQDLSCRLRAYILAHLLVLVPLVFEMARHPRPDNIWLVGVLLLFTVVCSTWRVELTIFQGKMTLTFAVVCLALLLQGAQAALLCAALGAIVGSLVRPAGRGLKLDHLKPSLFNVVFNVANCTLACGLSALVYDIVVYLGPRTQIEMVLGIIPFTASYCLINTLGVSLAIALQQNLPWLSVWQQNFYQTAPGYLTAAMTAVGIQALYQQMGAWSFICLTPIYFIYHTYRLYLDRIQLFTEKVQQDKAHIQELNKLNQAVIASLATAIEAKDRYACSRINHGQHYALALAQAAGVRGSELAAVATAALVHDIGKLGIPDHILGKPGKLTPEEFGRIQSHVTIGTELLSPIPFPFPVVDIVRTHHERWDGLGYPHGLKGEEIPFGGRIVAIVDVFDALTSDRPYRRAMSHEKAIQILKEGAGKQFDPHLVALFEGIMPRAHQEIERLEGEPLTQSPSASAPTPGYSAFTRISQAAAEMAAVAEVAHALANQETLEEIANVVVNRALALLPADTAVLYLKSPGDTGLIAAAVDGMYRSKLRDMTIEMGEGVAGWVARNQQPQVNVSAALDVARRFTPEESVELNAAAAVPLVHGADNLGVLAVYTVSYSVLSEHHLHVLNILAEHAAAAIQNSRRIELHRELAYTDPLTGLANSRSLVRHLERLTYPALHPDGSKETRFSVVMLDLDYFKQVNDTLGHLQGDDLLRLIGQVLVAVARPGDTVCRYAGDEFVLLLPGANRQQAKQVSARVREAIEAIPSVDGQVKIQASVGVAAFPEDGSDGRTLLHVADRRMYEDKFQRRGPLVLEVEASPRDTVAAAAR